jgi:flagellar assembly protein FliH
MGLIKANNPAASSSVMFSLADIEQHARQILAAARAEADQVLAQARKEAQSLRTTAQKEGHAAGLAQGKADGHKQGFEIASQQGKAQALTEHRAKLIELTNALVKASGALNQKLDAIDETVRNELIELALAIAGRVTKVTAAREVGVAEANIGEAIRLTMDKSSVRIAVHPTQRADLTGLLPQLKITWPTLKHVELYEDEAVGVGGCRVTSAHGEIDAAIDAQLERIAQELSPSPSGKGPA